MRFAIFTYTPPGKIIAVVECPEDQVSFQYSAENAFHVECGPEVTDVTHYITFVGPNETPTLTPFPERPSSWDEWNFSTGEWETSGDLQSSALGAKYAHLLTAYAAARSVPFIFESYSLSCDDLHIDGIRCVVSQIMTQSLMPDEWNGWRTIDGARMPATGTLPTELTRAQAILAAAESRRAACFSIFWNHMDAIEALTTAEDLEAYDVTTGWPTS